MPFSHLTLTITFDGKYYIPHVKMEKNNYKDESIAILDLVSKFFLWNERLKDNI